MDKTSQETLDQRIKYLNNYLKENFYVDIEKGNYINGFFQFRVNVKEAALHSMYNFEECMNKIIMMAEYLGFNSMSKDYFLYLDIQNIYSMKMLCND